MKHTDDSEMNDCNEFYLIVWMFVLLLAAGVLLVYHKLTEKY